MNTKQILAILTAAEAGKVSLCKHRDKNDHPSNWNILDFSVAIDKWDFIYMDYKIESDEETMKGRVQALYDNEDDIYARIHSLEESVIRLIGRVNTLENKV